MIRPEPPDPADVARIVMTALAEDVGGGDITTEAAIPANLAASGLFVAREKLVFCGGFIVEQVFRRLDEGCAVTPLAQEAQRVEGGQELLRAEGRARALLTGERAALNLLQHMCGVATLTAAFVDAAKGTGAVILDTRKTMPGLRALDKYAVRCGGGRNHRMGLYDAILIKDNHIALAGGIRQAVERLAGKGLIEVECDTVKQVEEALKLGVGRILLDNMSARQMKEAVALVAGKVPLEASGGVTLENVRKIAETGVDFISVGRLTHSAPAADIGLDIAVPGASR